MIRSMKMTIGKCPQPQTILHLGSGSGYMNVDTCYKA